ncbi:MAG: T9SS type A sorting domain-containing protein [Bacteroidetes bacterium]|nr:T9SS type A sorting domain-containing protein [Bacteroidota bacterium]
MVTQKLSYYIYSYAVDTTTNVLYYGGNSSGIILGAIDGTTGNAVSWGPFGLGGGDIVTQVLFSDNKIYIAGSFSQVKGSARKNIAAIDVSGSVLPWNPSGRGVNIAGPTNIAADKNYLYVGDFSFTALSVISKATGYLINDSVIVEDAGAPMLKIVYGDSLIAALTEYELILYKWEYNAFLEPVALRIVGREDLSSYGFYFDPQQYYGRGGAALVILNRNIYVMDNFIYSGKHSGALKFKWNSLNNQLTKQNYDIDMWSLCSSPIRPPEVPDYLVQPKINNAAYYDSTLYIGGFELSDLNRGSCGDPYSIISSSPYISNSSKGFSGNLLFGPDYYDVRQLKAVNNTLYQVSTREYVSGPDKYTIDSISAYCLTPMRPGKFAVYKAAVCPEDMGVKYEVPKVPGTTYSWTYSGTGAVIHSTGANSITMDFSMNPGPGDLTVIAISTCGLKSAPRTFHIIINTPPDANAGPDKEINCTDKTVVLLGSSTTSGVMYSWKRPDGSITTNAQPTASKAGQYILTVLETTNGCHWRDTAIVTIDTIKPVPLIPSGNNTLTCFKNTISINGGSSGSADSLRWKDAEGVSWPNPLQTGTAGNYKLIVLNTTNGCVAVDSVTVSSNKISPTVSASFTSADLTCKTDTLILIGSTMTSNTKLEWLGTGDTMLNPTAITKAGVYLLMATDTSNGCRSTQAVNINYRQYSPAINVPAGKTITCSSPSIILNGSSVSLNTVLGWKGPGSYVSTNPATVTDTGIYILTVTDTINGCQSIQQVNVDAKLSLAINKATDTTICPGGTVSLWASPLGGTPGYTYTWLNKGAVIGSGNTQIVSATDTMVYVVSISDNNGCIGTDSIQVYVPDPLASVVKAFQSCDPKNASGTLQIAASKGVPPYQYSIDGNNFQSAPVFSGLGLGQYTVTIKDTLGCIQTTSAEISRSSLLPKVDFLVSTNNAKGDTLVIVDISDPRPDKVTWQLPAGAQLLDTNSFAPTIIYDKTGSFILTMKAYFGTCEMQLNKTINFTPADSISANVNGSNGIEEIKIYPNPNNGTFTVEIKLFVKQAFVLQVYDAKSIEKYKQAISPSSYYFGSITIPEAENGTYILKVTAEHDSKQRSIIVTQ